MEVILQVFVWNINILLGKEVSSIGDKNHLGIKTEVFAFLNLSSECAPRLKHCLECQARILEKATKGELRFF